MTGQQLKNSILQLAIQGKLVPQNPDDEPASELLKRIRAEKEKLVKEKKIKKEKPLPEISEDEKPFEIPDGWVWCRLGEIFKTTSGSTPLSSNTSYYNGDINWTRTTDLNNGYLFTCEKKITELAVKECNLTIIPQDSVCIAMYGGAGTIGKYSLIKFDTTINQSVCAIYPNNFCSMEFVYYFMQYQRPLWMNFAAGSRKDPNINKVIINNCILPLPPLSEQHRIVEKIEELMPLVDEYDKAQKELNTLNANLPEALKKSILQEAIQGKLGTNNPDDEPASELLKRIRAEKEKLIKEKKIKKEKPLPEISEDEKPFDIPDNWVWCRLNQICTKIVDGDHNPPTGLQTETEFIMLSSQNINDNTLVNLDKVRYLDESTFEKEDKRTEARVGDILFTSVGTLGKSCILINEMKICFQRSVTIISTLALNEYVKYVLDSPTVQSFVIENATGTAQKGFYINQMEQLLIPLPPLQEQHRIVEILNNILPKLKKL